MQKREKVPATSGQVGEICGVLVGEMDFSKTEASAIIGNLGQFRKDVREFYKTYRTKSTSLGNIAVLHRWMQVYEKFFGNTPDFSTLQIPAKPEEVGPIRLIVVAKEIIAYTDGRYLQGTMNSLKKYFPTGYYAGDLDKEISINDRDPSKGSYAIWVKDVREADEDNQSKSVNDLKDQDHTGITLLERMLLEFDYWSERGEHLDLQKMTLCSGSRHRNGGVPVADWNDGKFSVVWYDPSRRYPDLRSRSVWV